MDIDWRPPTFAGLTNSDNIVHALAQDERDRQENGEDEETCSSDTFSIRNPNASQYKGYTPSAARESQRAALIAGGESAHQQVSIRKSPTPPKTIWQAPCGVEQGPTGAPGAASGRALSTPSQVQAAQCPPPATSVNNRVWQKALQRESVGDGPAGRTNSCCKADGGVVDESVPDSCHPVRWRGQVPWARRKKYGTKENV